MDKDGHVKTPTFVWWWLELGAEVDVEDGYAMQTIALTSRIGRLKIVTRLEVSGWGVTELPFDPNWGEKP